MIKLRTLSYLLVLPFLPMGCSQDSGPPTAPVGPAAAAGDTGKPAVPPAPVTKGRRAIHPGGGSTATP